MIYNEELENLRQHFLKIRFENELNFLETDVFTDLDVEEDPEWINTRKEKIDAIRPTPKNFEKFDDVIDFYFSIQDFYKFNPQTYEESIENIEAFFKIYDIIFTGTPQPDYYYQIAESKKNNAINALHALIYNLPNSRIVNEKLIRAHKRLETILNKYLNQLYDHCTQKIIKEGRDWYTRQINIGPKEYNTYFNLNKSFTYQFY